MNSTLFSILGVFWIPFFAISFFLVMRQISKRMGIRQLSGSNRLLAHFMSFGITSLIFIVIIVGGISVVWYWHLGELPLPLF